MNQDFNANLAILAKCADEEMTRVQFNDPNVVVLNAAFLLECYTDFERFGLMGVSILQQLVDRVTSCPSMTYYLLNVQELLFARLGAGIVSFTAEAIERISMSARFNNTLAENSAFDSRTVSAFCHDVDESVSCLESNLWLLILLLLMYYEECMPSLVQKSVILAKREITEPSPKSTN